MSHKKKCKKHSSSSSHAPNPNRGPRGHRGKEGKSAAELTKMQTRKHNTTQTIANSLGTVVQYNTIVDTYKPIDLLYDSSTNLGRFTNNSRCVRVFNVSTTVSFDVNTTGYRFVYIEKTSGSTVTRVAEFSTNTLASDNPVLNISTPIVLYPNEYFTVLVYQTSGSNLSIGSGTFGGSYISILQIV